MNREEVKKKIFPKVNLGEFAQEQESTALKFVRILTMAFLNCGGLFIKDRNPLQEVSDEAEVFQFGDFSRLIALMRKLVVIIPISDAGNKFDSDQESAMRMIGIKTSSYRNLIRELSSYCVDLSDLDKDLDHTLKDDFIKLLDRAGCLFRQAQDSLRRPKPGLYSELKGGPYHKLNFGSSIDNLSKIVAGLTMVIDHEPEKKKPEYNPLDDIWNSDYFSYQDNYSGYSRSSKDTKSYFISLAAPVCTEDLLRLKIARVEVAACGLYSAKENAYLVKHSTMINQVTISDMDIADPNHESASEDLARVLANCMQREERRESFSVERQKELFKLSELWKRHFQLTHLGYRHRRSDDRYLVEYCKPQFTELLAGRTYLEGNLDFLKPPKFNTLLVAEAEFRSPGILGTGFETETELFDGAEVTKLLETIRAQIEVVRSLKETQAILAARRSTALTKEVVAEVQALCPKCPCPMCKDAKEHSTTEAFAQPDVANFLVSQDGLVICKDTSSILNISNRQAGFGSGWTKKVGEISVGNVFYRAFNKNGRLVLTIRVERN